MHVLPKFFTTTKNKHQPKTNKPTINKNASNIIPYVKTLLRCQFYKDTFSESPSPYLAGRWRIDSVCKRHLEEWKKTLCVWNRWLELKRKEIVGLKYDIWNTCIILKTLNFLNSHISMDKMYAPWLGLPPFSSFWLPKSEPSNLKLV
jgi:hypothetical protein